MPGRCAICDETDPMPASICLAKLVGEAETGHPCQYSAEGCERTRVAMERQSERYAPLLEEARAHGAAVRARLEATDVSGS